METKNCIYCRRTLDLSVLSEKAGQYRCTDENDCLEYQNREDPADAVAMADYISDVVKSSLIDARQRIAAYKSAKDRQAKSIVGNGVNGSEESIAEFAWMKSAVDILASEYKENSKYVFQFDETNGHQYKISLNDAGNDLYFAVTIENPIGSRYAMRVAGNGVAGNSDPFYEEFIYKSYPGGEKEDLIKDLSVILMSFKEEKSIVTDLLNAFRIDIEARSYNNDAANR